MLYIYLIICVQTVFESLPVSSSGHVALLTSLCEKYGGLASEIAALPPELFEPWFHSLHAITALILAIFFLREWFFLLANFVRTWRIVCKLIFLVGIADVLTSGWYVLFHWYPVSPPLYVGFFITGVLLASLRFAAHAHGRRAFNVRDAIMLGAVQGIALVPGISRFAATFVASRWLGYSNERAFQLTWMIQWPLIAAASVLGFYDLYRVDALAQFYSGWLLVAYLCAGVGGYAALAVAHWCAVRDRLWWFAYYMIIPLAIALWI